MKAEERLMKQFLIEEQERLEREAQEALER